MPQIIDLPTENSQTDVLRYLGYQPQKSQLSSAVQTLLQQCQVAFQAKVKARGVYRSGSLTDFSLQDYWGSADLVRTLQGAQRVTLLAVTLGQEVDTEIERLFASRDYAQAAIWDALGSDAAEQAMQSLYYLVNRSIREQGYSLSPRFSPGYGDLSLKQQPLLHGLVAGNSIGIAVTPQHLLLPRKSITALAGWIKADKITLPSNCVACVTCDLADCQYRSREIRREEER